MKSKARILKPCKIGIVLFFCGIERVNLDRSLTDVGSAVEPFGERNAVKDARFEPSDVSATREIKVASALKDVVKYLVIDGGGLPVGLAVPRDEAKAVLCGKNAVSGVNKLGVKAVGRLRVLLPKKNFIS